MATCKNCSHHKVMHDNLQKCATKDCTCTEFKANRSIKKPILIMLIIFIATVIVILAIPNNAHVGTTNPSQTGSEQKQISVSPTQTDKPLQTQKQTYGDLRDFDPRTAKVVGDYDGIDFASWTTKDENGTTYSHVDYTKATYWFKITQETATYLTESRSNAHGYLIGYTFEASEMYREMFKHNATEVTISTVVAGYDSYGKPQQVLWISTTMSKKTADKIDWYNFMNKTWVADPADALFRIADTFYIHPSLL